MAFANTFVEELSNLTGETVEIAYDNTLLEGVVASAGGSVVTVAPTTGYYTPSQSVIYINTAVIDFVRILS